MGNLARFTGTLKDIDTVHLFDDFQADLNAGLWSTVISDIGTAAVGDARKGILTVLASDASVADNDELYVYTANELFLFAAGKPLYGKAYIQYAEGNTDDNNVIFGFQNAVAANSLADDGGGPRATGSYAVIYKVDGGTVWRCQSRNGSEVTDSISATTAGGSAYQLLEIEVADYTPTRCQITYKVDGQFLKFSNGQPIVHQLLVAAATEMALVLGAKNGANTTVVTLLCDYLYAHQLR